MPCFNTRFRLEGKIAPLSFYSLIRYWMSNMASDAKVSLSSKVEYGAVIWYLYLKGKTGQEIHCELTNVYGSSATSYAQVKFWVGEFKHSRTSLEDETRSGRPSDAIDEEMCNKVRDLVYSDRRIKVEEKASALHFSHGIISTTLHDRLGMHKLTAHWVPKSLSDEQTANRASVYSALLKQFRSKEPASVAQLDAPSDWRPGGHGFNPRRGRQHSFIEIDHEIFSTVILSLPLIQEGQLSVSGERMCTILVNRFED